MLKRLRNNILVGLLLVTPIVVTAFVVNWLFTFITNRVLVFLPKQMREGEQEMLWRFASLFLVLLVMFLVGVLARNFLGRKLYQEGDRVLGRIPVVKSIYVGTRQVIESLIQQRRTLFQEVVLIQYPRPGLFALGFVTAIVPPSQKTNMPTAFQVEECLSIFIPTTPNPTSGWFCIAPRSQVIKLGMTSGEAMKLIMSGGAVYPDSSTQQKGTPPSLLDLLHEWSSEQPPPDAQAKTDQPPAS